MSVVRCVWCFFFQAEDGIRDRLVTGVQTCALPIFIIKTTPGQLLFSMLAEGVTGLLEFAEAGSDFVFGSLADSEQSGFILAFQVLPVVVFIASFFSVLYFIGLMQRVVDRKSVV